MISTVFNEGVKGMQSSSREMQKAAHEIAQLNVREDSPVGSTNPEDQAILPVGRTEESGNLGNIAEPVIELKRQELLFTAAAKIVEVADDTLGSILDTRS